MSLPSGVVTFLFTDIEGSTLRWEAQRDSMAAALLRHNEILRTAIEEQGGIVFKTVGDAFCAVFSRPADAVIAAVESQRTLLDEDWSKYGPHFDTLRVRMAIHTGAVDPELGDYLGPPLNQVARCMSAAHGGQVLVSRALGDLASGQLPEAIAFKDLGHYRLKDLKKPMQLLQVLADGLPSVFPPLRAIPERKSSLPTPITNFVGRARVRAEVCNQLKSSRLLSLVGIGGAGKTRLALQVAGDVASEFPDGVWFVDLSSAVDGAAVVITVAMAVGVREESRRSIGALLMDWLKDLNALIVLDNCEQVVDACAAFASQALSSSPGLKLLTTSRETLGVSGEVVVQLPPLEVPAVVPKAPTPADVASLCTCEAVHLFLDRAAMVRPDFALSPANVGAVAAICRTLDGIPLAIELAAARVRYLEPDEINARLADRFRLLRSSERGLAPRQMTLRASLEWSYDLLSEDEQRLLAYVAVFRGGWSLEAAEAVCSDAQLASDDVLDVLGHLVVRSLVVVSGSPEAKVTRYSLLETVRVYASEKLLSYGAMDHVRERHLKWIMDTIETLRPMVNGGRQNEALSWFRSELDNIAAAHEWCLASPSRSSRALRLVRRSTRFWLRAGMFAAGRQMAEEALAANRHEASSLDLAGAMMAAGTLAQREGDLHRAADWQKAALEHHRAIGDDVATASSLHNLALVTRRLGDYDQAAQLLEESLSLKRAEGNPWRIATSVEALAIIRQHRGDLDTALQFYSEAREFYRETSDDLGLARVIDNMGTVWRLQGANAQARSASMESLRLMRELGNGQGISSALGHLAALNVDSGDFDDARCCLDEAMLLAGIIGHGERIAYISLLDAELHFAKGDAAEAAKHLRTAATRPEDLVGGDLAWALEVGAALAVGEGDWRRAATLLAVSAATRQRMHAIVQAPRLLERNSWIRSRTLEALGSSGLVLAEEVGLAMEPNAALALAVEGTWAIE